MTSTAPALTITCAKPDCHWAGSAADAPTHDCPTPAVNKNVNTSTPGIGEAERMSFAAERADIEQRLQAAGVEYSADLSLDDLRGLAQLLVDPVPEKTEPEPEPEPSAPVEPEPAEKLGRGRKAAELAAAIAEKATEPSASKEPRHELAPH